jgi:penicillin-binding protein 1A
VLDARNAFIMDSMMRDVTHSGTGYMAGQKINRRDVAGKTGTTNDTVDGWFAGYGGNVVAVSWMGYDSPKSLGNREFGSTLALPIWVDYMRTAIKGQPDSPPAMPDGLAQVNGEYVYQEYMANLQPYPVESGTPGNFWDRLFGTPAPAPRERESDMEKRRQQEIYGG